MEPLKSYFQIHGKPRGRKNQEIPSLDSKSLHTLTRYRNF